MAVRSASLPANVSLGAAYRFTAHLLVVICLSRYYSILQPITLAVRSLSLPRGCGRGVEYFFMSNQLSTSASRHLGLDQVRMGGLALSGGSPR